jgi:hypothetical protein
VVLAMQTLAGRGADRGMDVTNPPLPCDDKRKRKGNRGQESAPSVHCFEEPKTLKKLHDIIIREHGERNVKRERPLEQSLLWGCLTILRRCDLFATPFLAAPHG